MGLESVITKIEKEIKDEKFVYVEKKIKPEVDFIFDNSNLVDERYFSKLKNLFKKISSINKSVSFGINFYENLAKSDFPFSHEVLREAIDTELDSKCNDSALVAYIEVSLRVTGVQKKVLGNLTRHIYSGHYFDYIDILRKVKKSKPKEKFDINKELKETLLKVVRKNKFPQTVAKSLCSLVYFDIKEVIPILEEKIKKYSVLSQEELNEKFYSILFDITTNSVALECLTGEKKYGKLANLVKNSGGWRKGIFRKVEYSEDFVKTLVEKIRKL